MEPLQLKLLLMGVTFASTTLVGVLPLIFRGACGKRITASVPSATRARMLSCASCFSAGVFLFVCFMGLLPAADSKFHLILKRLSEENSSLNNFSEFPWGFFIVTCGFLIIFTIDKLVHAFDVGRRSRASKKKSSKSSTPQSDVTLLSVKESSTSATTPLSGGDAPLIADKMITVAEYINGNVVTVKMNSDNLPQTSAEGCPRGSHQQVSSEPARQQGLQWPDDKQSYLELEQQRDKMLEPRVILEQHSHAHGVPSSVIFLVALGIHSLFEGVAVGLQTEREKILEFGVAVLVHELVMAFTFGLQVSRSRRLSVPWQVCYVMLFTASIPLGIAAGAGLNKTESRNREIVAAVLEAVATGIFLHVIFIEIIGQEFAECDHSSHSKHQNKRISEHPKDSTTSEIMGISSEVSSSPPEVRLIIEKILSICCGLLTLILLNVLMHSHHE